MNILNTNVHRITCSLRSLKAASLAAANDRDERRLYLKSVFIQATATTTRLVATNGHILLVIDEEQKNVLSEKRVEFIIPLEDIKGLKVRWSSEENVTIEFEDVPSKLHLTTQGKTQIVEAMDTRYPDYTRVIPKPQKIKYEEKGKTLHRLPLPPISDKYHAILSSAIRLWAGEDEKRGLSAALYPAEGEEDPVLVFHRKGVDAIEGRRCLGVLMPLKMDSWAAPKVEWAATPLPETVDQESASLSKAA